MALSPFRTWSAHVVLLGSVSSAKGCCKAAPHCCERRAELSHAELVGMKNAWFPCHRSLRTIGARTHQPLNDAGHASFSLNCCFAPCPAAKFVCQYSSPTPFGPTFIPKPDRSEERRVGK